MLLVVFETRIGSPRIAWLKRGFRHCFICRASGDSWVLCNPLSWGVALDAHPLTSARRLAITFASLGASVVVRAEAQPVRPLPWLRPTTCVEICKRVLGINAPCLLTPFQLFRRLTTEGVDGSQ